MKGFKIRRQRSRKSELYQNKKMRNNWVRSEGWIFRRKENTRRS